MSRSARPELERAIRASSTSPRATSNRDELEPILEAVFRERSSEEWLAVLREAGVPSSR